MEFKDNLKKCRTAKNISQEELAERLGVSRQSTSKWETGEAYPSMEHLFMLCEVLEVELGDLTGEKFNNEKHSDTKSGPEHKPKGYNKAWFLQTLSTTIHEDYETCVKINDILEDHLPIGRRHKTEFLTRIQDDLDCSLTRAEEIHNAVFSILSQALKERLRHPFSRGR